MLTIALADTILPGVLYSENLKMSYRLYPERGYGEMVHKWAVQRILLRKQFWQWRSNAHKPCRVAYDDLDTVLRQARVFTEVTHNHSEGIKGAQSVATAIFLARTDYTKNRYALLLKFISATI